MVQRAISDDCSDKSRASGGSMKATCRPKLTAFDSEVWFSSGKPGLCIAETTTVHGDYDEKPTESGKSCGPLCRYP